jgi:hypothetical protein
MEPNKNDQYAPPHNDVLYPTYPQPQQPQPYSPTDLSYYPSNAQYDPAQTSTPYVDYSYTSTQQAHMSQPLVQPSPQVYTSNTTVYTLTSQDDKQQHDLVLILLVVGFFIPLTWIIAFFMTRSQSPRCKRLGNICCM